MDYSRITRVTEIAGANISALDLDALVNNAKPVIYRAAYQSKNLVAAGNRSVDQAMDFISQHHSGADLTVFSASPEHRGRFFYNADATELGFESRKMSLDDFFNALLQTNKSAVPGSFYAGSTDIQTFFPGLIEADNLVLSNDAFKENFPIISIWMGNRTTAVAHFDMSNNIAACMVGRRRFTLFPPDQIHNLYPGPLFPTPAGQVVSMVDFRSPDWLKYPKFERALETAQVADLYPGDVLVYPAMWWHQVEALDAFNVLINYWWNSAPKYIDAPIDTLFHGLISLRSRSKHEKEAWRELFDYYLFEDSEKASGHLTPAAQGVLGKMTLDMSRRLRMMLLNKLNR